MQRAGYECYGKISGVFVVRTTDEEEASAMIHSCWEEVKMIVLTAK